MSTTGIQGKILEINVVGCRNLADKEWFSRQDPYVIVEYASNRFRTKTDTDGGKNPTFNEKFMIPLIEGLREVIVQVWNSNTVSLDDHIGSTKVLLDKVLSSGYDNTPWPLRSKYGKSSGEVNLILHYGGGKDKHQGQASSHAAYPQPVAGYPAQPSYGAPPPYGAPPLAPYPATPAPGYPPPSAYPSGYPPTYAAPPPPFGAPPPVYGTPPPAAPYGAPPSGYPPATGYPSAVPGYLPQSGYPPQPGYPGAAAPGYPPQAPGPYGHKTGKVHVGSHTSHDSHGKYKHGKHKKHKGYKFAKKFKDWGKGWKG